MATKSIYKNINIKDKAFCRALVSALENAQNKKAKDVEYTRTFSEAKGEQIKEMFEENK